MDANNYGITEIHLQLLRMFMEKHPRYQGYYFSCTTEEERTPYQLNGFYLSYYDPFADKTVEDLQDMLVIKNGYKYKKFNKTNLKINVKAFKHLKKIMESEEELDGKKTIQMKVTHKKEIIEKEILEPNNLDVEELNYLLIPIEEAIRIGNKFNGVAEVKAIQDQIKYEYLQEVIEYAYTKQQTNLVGKVKVKKETAERKSA